VVSNILRHYNFEGLDEQGEAIYNPSKPKPILKFIGTVKLHGTNFGINFNDEFGMWCQSKENIIIPQKDNAGSAFFAESNKEVLLDLFMQIKQKYNIDTSTHTISLYFEWVGKGIQSKVGICNLDKSAFIIGIKISNLSNEEEAAYWVDCKDFRAPEYRIYNIFDYKTYEIDIDFNHPELSQNKLIEMTLEVENECPVSKAFGFPNEIGEGIVFVHESEGKRYVLKSKGEKHAGKSKVKTLKPVDNDRINKVLEIADKVTPEWRLDQMLTQSCDLLNGGQIETTKLGDFIRLVINDVLKEELDVLAEASVEPKEINKYISDIARKYFFSRFNESVGLNK
jgi:hypothetical protein